MRVFDQKMKALGLNDTTLGAKVGKSSKTIFNYRRDDNPTTPDHPTALLLLAELDAITWAELMNKVDESITTNA